MKQTDDTSEFQLTPPGEYVFTVDSVPIKKKTKNGNGSFRIWEFAYNEGSEKKTVRMVILPSQSHELLLALGGEEIAPRKIEWDDESVVGKTIKARIIHEQGNDGKIRERLVDIVSAEVAWDGA